MAIVRVRPEDYKVVGDEPSHGSSLELSPYDMPRVVESKYDKVRRTFEIHVTYRDEEDAVTKALESLDPRIHITVAKGKHSGKILGLYLGIEMSDLDKLADIILPALEREIRDADKFNQKANYKLISSILHRQQDKIFKDIND